MKNKIRSIVVDTERYTWSVVEDSWPKGTLKVWIDGDKNSLYLQTEVSVSEPVTPAIVEKVIRVHRSSDIKKGP